MVDQSHKTALTRTKISAPTRYLKENNKLTGRLLDFGCGKGYDADALNMVGYDPYYRPEKPMGLFDNITCHYVLNVVQEEQVEDILNDIRSLLTDNGTAFISIRCDVKREGFTKRGTYQVNRKLDLPVILKKSHFIMYKLQKEEV